MRQDQILYSRWRQFLIGLSLFACMAAWPFVFKNVYFYNILFLTFLYISLSQSWNILSGYCGQISLGHSIYFGIGAYTSFIILQKFGISPWLGMIGGAFLSVGVSFLVGYACFQMEGHYYSIATLVIAEMALLSANSWDYIGGALGIELIFKEESWWTLQFARTRLPFLYLALGLAVITWCVTFFLEESRWGYGWRAVRDNREAAESLGVNVFRSKMMAAAVSAFFTALGGSLYAFFVGYIDPINVMHFRFSLLMALPAVVGGIGTLWGPVIGACLLIPLTEFTHSYFGGSGTGLDLMIYGACIIAISLIRPEGLVSFFSRSVPQSGRKPCPL